MGVYDSTNIETLFARIECLEDVVCEKIDKLDDVKLDIDELYRMIESLEKDVYIIKGVMRDRGCIPRCG